MCRRCICVCMCAQGHNEGPEWSECARRGLAVKPKRGNMARAGGGRRERESAPSPAVSLLVVTLRRGEDHVAGLAFQKSDAVCVRPPRPAPPRRKRTTTAQVLFWSLFPNGTIDMMASHTACPVSLLRAVCSSRLCLLLPQDRFPGAAYLIAGRATHVRAPLALLCAPCAAQVVKGEKWSAPKWLRTNNFQREHRSAPIVEPCVDMHAGCKDWAAKGECEANAAFMVGAKGAIGQCRVSCNACPYPKLLGTTGNGAPKPVKDSFLTETIARRTGVGKKADEEDQRRRRI